MPGEFTMTARAPSTALLMATGLLWVSNPASSQQAPPDSEQARQVVALVDAASAEIISKGKAAFSELRVQGSKWRKGNTYLFAGDLKGMVWFNAVAPKLEGTDASGLTDARGKKFVVEFLSTVKSRGSGWVDYMRPKPGEKKPSQKWSYVKATKLDGTPGYVGAVFYPQ